MHVLLQPRFNSIGDFSGALAFFRIRASCFVLWMGGRAIGHLHNDDRIQSLGKWF